MIIIIKQYDPNNVKKRGQGPKIAVKKYLDQ